MAYLTIPLKTDPGEILAGMIADYQSRMPGWQPNPASPEYQMFAVFALRHAIRLDVDSQVGDQIYRYSGTTIDGVPYLAATYANADTTWTVVDDAGYTIQAGWRLSIPINGNTSADFTVGQTVTIPEGETTATVPIVAAVAGAASSGLDGAVTLDDARTWVASIVLVEATQAGQDAEPDSDYLDRLTRKRQRLTDTIVTSSDAIAALLDEVPGIGAVLLLDNSDDSTIGSVPGAFRLILRAPDGSNCSTDTKAAALALVEATRLLNLAAYIDDPVVTDVAVTYKFTVLPGADPTEVEAAGDVAVGVYADKATWGTVPTDGSGSVWVDDTLFRYSEIYAALNSVPGLDHVTELKINGSANTNATLTGPGALPNLTSVAGTLDS